MSLLSNDKKSQIFRDFLRTEEWSYHVSVARMRNMQQHFRDITHYQNVFNRIEYNLNKKYLSTRWNKFDMKDRFYFVGFTHGTPQEREQHFHFLLHTPLQFFKNEFYKEEVSKVIKLDFLTQTLDRLDKRLHDYVLQEFERTTNELINIKRIADTDYHNEVTEYHTKWKMKEQLFDIDDCFDFFYVS